MSVQELESVVREQLPEINEIDDPQLQEKVVRLWATALEESEFERLEEVPWESFFMPYVGESETQVGHIRETTQCVIAYADLMMQLRPDLDIDRDLLVAGTLIHDISKFYETRGKAAVPGGESEDAKTELAKNLPHPHFAIHLIEEVGLPIEIQNIVLAHTENTNVECNSLEAKILESVDLLVTDTVLWEKSGQFKFPNVVSRTIEYIDLD